MVRNIGAGYAVVIGALKLYFLSMGMLIYTVINSSGYYAQSGDFTFVILFAGLLILAVFFTVLFVRNKI